MPNTDTEPKHEIPVEHTSRNELAKRLRQMEGVSDELADKIADNWKKIIGGVATLALIAWLVQGYRENRERQLNELSYRFSQIQASFAEIGAERPVEDPAKLVALQNSIQVLAESDGAPVYTGLARLYQAADALAEQDPERALLVLKEFNLANYFNHVGPTAVRPISTQEFLSELAALLALRSELARDGMTPELVSRIKSLAYSAQYVSLEAVVMLLRLASTPEQKVDAAKLADVVSQSRPELQDRIRAEQHVHGIIVDSGETS